MDAADALHRLHLTCVEPLIIAARKRRRLAALGLERLDDIPYGTVDLAAGGRGCAGTCAAALAAERRYLSRYLAAPGRLPVPPALRGIPAVITLDRYPDFAGYAARVRRHSKGGILRQVRRARAQGFVCRQFYSDFYRRQRFAIDTSRRFRSGLVLASLLRRPPVSEFPAGLDMAEIAAYLGRPAREIGEGCPLPEPPAPACTRHWQIDWGIFLPEEGAAGDRRERLVGYILLRRSGSIVRTAGVMGHGAYLAQHVMKLLFHDVMEWLLRRTDPSVQGIQYLLYGAVEHGNDGLFAWKRSFEFEPLRFCWRVTS